MTRHPPPRVDDDGCPICYECGEHIVGRADKIYCNELCRDRFRRAEKKR